MLAEMAGPLAEERTESRPAKAALDRLGGVFDLLQSNHSTVPPELNRARTEVRDQADSASRPMLPDVVDLRDWLVAALKPAEPAG